VKPLMINQILKGILNTIHISVQQEYLLSSYESYSS
jgi:hypothetical protein